ncbi:GH116 family glycosyl-hydrolase [Pelagicoccus sp. SDUM812005]|uniref:GH116 family glycosyl-hydrolase n=1 Tax=Pelagicoccus sp. SDUM812005 TaxID=3041257 RepID=UPI002810454E|nr:GH116 family glycosyl-hydrolase [Pelagicoccus sp. SDUM812005]MDQ8183306.1 GH116 family glycosyl-hydrolase [Pelagicoccus sp. SDUM812005]
MNTNRSACQGEGDVRSTPLQRRDFIKATGLAVGALWAGRLPVMAGPFSQDDLAGHLVPVDKKFSRQWLDALTCRGEAEVFSGEQLRYIGMPVGGIGCGQLYLGGDGRLWHWDIFKSNYHREKHEMRMDAMTMGGHYTKPVSMGEVYSDQNGAKVQQGFAIRAKSDDRVLERSLDQIGFPEVTFRGEYPVGRVSYEDSAFPAKVQLEAFSPFIPLNAKDSALPATVMRFTVTNRTERNCQIELAGWLQNAVCPYLADTSLGRRVNRLGASASRSSILSTIDGGDAIAAEHGYGSSALTVLQGEGVRIRSAVTLKRPETIFSELEIGTEESAAKPLDQALVGGLGAYFELEPGASKVVTFLVSWYFPRHQKYDRSPDLFTGRHYGPWFHSAGEVADYVVEKAESLIDGTLLWNKTWYDSTLPHWLLDRSMISLGCVATQTFHWFDNDRPWAWEGVDCCEGSCTHVFHYAQGLSRIFPELERKGREIVDYGIAFNEESAGVGYRGDARGLVADDGQAGTILRVYREHQMSADGAFLKRIWPKVKRSIAYLMAKDPDADGILTEPQAHTLDATWTGKIAWISSMYLAALAAGEAMARELGDEGFAESCRGILDRGYKSIVDELFDGEYFIHKPDESAPAHLNTNRGCHIDQLLGQSWIHQVGLGRVVPKKETVSALESLWKYNFAPDAGAYAIRHREIEQAFRWYAMEGEAGLLMTTWPKGGAKEAIPGDKLRPAKNPELWTGPGGYFNECMNGFEYQVAGHMVSEGEADGSLVEKGLAIMKAVHDRYGAAKRNPYNEIECSDHYIRSMASYGVFLAACGFAYHGPEGRIGFAPKVHPEDFRAPFTAAEGWGTFSQRISAGSMRASLRIRWGSLSLNTISLKPIGFRPRQVEVTYRGQALAAGVSWGEDRTVVRLGERLKLETGMSVTVKLS